MSKIFWVIFALDVFMIFRTLSSFSAVSVISLTILLAAVFCQVRAFRIMRADEKEQHA